MKWCSKCRKWKLLPEFYACRQAKDGLNYWCKECNRGANRKYGQTEKAKIARRKYQQSKKGKQTQKEYAATINGQRIRKNNHLKSRYGLTINDYDRLSNEQNGCCAICGESKHVLSVDHNHNTKEIRGLLCRHCNTLLGHAKDNLAILHAAIRYLEYEKLSKHIA